jgi:hypothetical protein
MPDKIMQITKIGMILFWAFILLMIVIDWPKDNRTIPQPKVESTTKQEKPKIEVPKTTTLVKPEPPKSELSLKLEARMASVKETRSKLSIKKRQLEESNASYKQDIEALAVEIKKVSLDNRVTNLNEAMQVVRIKNNLQLIREKKAYIEVIQGYIKKISVAEDELIVMEEGIEADKALAQVLDDQDAKRLVSKIDTALQKHIPTSEKFPIKIDEKNLKSFSEIWQEITNPKKGGSHGK